MRWCAGRCVRASRVPAISREDLLQQAASSRQNRPARWSISSHLPTLQPTNVFSERERWDFRAGWPCGLATVIMHAGALAPNTEQTDKERQQRSWQIDCNNQENTFLQSHRHRVCCLSRNRASRDCAGRAQRAAISPPMAVSRIASVQKRTSANGEALACVDTKTNSAMPMPPDSRPDRTKTTRKNKSSRSKEMIRRRKNRFIGVDAPPGGATSSFRPTTCVGLHWYNITRRRAVPMVSLRAQFKQ